MSSIQYTQTNPRQRWVCIGILILIGSFSAIELGSVLFAQPRIYPGQSNEPLIEIKETEPVIESNKTSTGTHWVVRASEVIQITESVLGVAQNIPALVVYVASGAFVWGAHDLAKSYKKTQELAIYRLKDIEQVQQLIVEYRRLLELSN